jgi:protein-S-isoprenylcysteine O-methyltransferase Ste14
MGAVRDLFAFLERQMEGLPRPWWAFLLLYESLVLGAFVLEQIVLRRVRAATGDPTAGGRRDRSYLGKWAIQFLLLQAVFVRAGRWWSAIDLSVGVLVLGVLVAVAGEAIRIRAMLELADNFSYVPQVREGHRLVTTGPYRYVRHPLYLGLLVYFIGLGLVLRDFILLCIFVGYVAVAIARRIRREERELAERFGGEYEAWRRRTKRLVPFLF